MPDEATIAVLRDMAMLIVMALAVGFAAYSYARHKSPLVSWTPQGNVSVLSFDLPDAVLTALLVFMLVGGLLTGDTAQGSGITSPKATESQQLGGLVMQIIVMFFGASVIWFWCKLVRGVDPVETFGLRLLSKRRIFITAVFWIVPTMILVSLAHEAVSTLMKGVWPMDDPQEIVKSFQSSGSLPVRILMGIAAAILAPLTEELMFRGLIYGVIKRYTDGWFGALVTSLLFATVHMHVGSFVPLFILAIALTAAYEYTGNLLVPMAMHAIFNTLMLGAMLTGT